MPDNDQAPEINPRRPVLFLLTSNWVSLLGAALVTTAGFSWLFVLPLHLAGGAGNPYIGLLAFIGIPVIFFAGLALIPVGIFLGKRRIAAGLAVPNRRVIIQRLVVFFGVMTVINIVIGSQVTYRAVAQMETNQFCGQSCHVMKPEFTAHLTGPHQKVGCVECHITPGASGFIAANIAGSRQLELVAFNSFPRPIPAGLESNRLAPSVDTCEQCHSRERNSGSKLRIISKFKDDEANTPTKTVLMMSIGGGVSGGGIHGAHMGPGVVMRYAAADAKRQTIPWVEYHNTNTGETGPTSPATPSLRRLPPCLISRWSAPIAITGRRTLSNCLTRPSTAHSPRAGFQPRCLSRRKRASRFSRRHTPATTTRLQKSRPPSPLSINRNIRISGAKTATK